MPHLELALDLLQVLRLLGRGQVRDREPLDDGFARQLLPGVQVCAVRCCITYITSNTSQTVSQNRSRPCHLRKAALLLTCDNPHDAKAAAPELLAKCEALIQGARQADGYVFIVLCLHVPRIHARHAERRAGQPLH